MKIKLVSKADKSANGDPLVVLVNWGGSESPSGVVVPDKKYIEKVSVGQTLEVPDQLGYAIMSKYQGCFVMVADQKAAVPENKVAVPSATK